MGCFSNDVPTILLYAFVFYRVNDLRETLNFEISSPVVQLIHITHRIFLYMFRKFRKILSVAGEGFLN